MSYISVNSLFIQYFILLHVNYPFFYFYKNVPFLSSTFKHMVRLIYFVRINRYFVYLSYRPLLSEQQSNFVKESVQRNWILISVYRINTKLTGGISAVTKYHILKELLYSLRYFWAVFLFLIERWVVLIVLKTYTMFTFYCSR